MVLRVKTYESIPGKTFVSGVIETEAELEEFANAIGSEVYPADEDDPGRCWVHTQSSDVNVSICVTIGTYVGWDTKTSTSGES